MKDLCCLICQKEYSKEGIKAHYWRSHTDIGLQFKPHFPESFKPWNKGLTKSNSKINDSIEKRKRKYEKIGFPLKGRKLSEEVKKKISNSMKLVHESGMHSGWSHVNADPNHLSYPEKYLIELFKKNGFFEKYRISIHKPFGKYFLDFSFDDLGVDLELDGKQHYASNEAIVHDIKRTEFINAFGWFVYRIDWNQLKLNNEYELERLKSFLDDSEKFNRSYEIPKKKFEIKILEKKEKIIQKIKILKESGIDFSKLGWVLKASKILNLRTQHVGKWLNKHDPEFYDCCFKRNPSS